MTACLEAGRDLFTAFHARSRRPMALVTFDDANRPGHAHPFDLKRIAVDMENSPVNSAT